MICAIAQNVLFLLYYSDKCFRAGDKHVESARSNFRPTRATHVTNSDFEAKLISKLLLTGTRLRKQAVATPSYSLARILNPQVIYATAFSAGLNGFQVTKLIARTINELLLTLLAACTTRVQ